MITLYFPLDLDLPLYLLCPNGPLLFLRPLFSMTRTCVSLPAKSFLQISSLNRLFLTIANMNFPSRDEFPRDTTKVFQLSGNEQSSKHARVSSSSERPTIDNYTIIPSKSFRCSAIDWPSLSFKFISFHIKKIFSCVFFASYMFSKFFQSVWGSASLAI